MYKKGRVASMFSGGSPQSVVALNDSVWEGTAADKTHGEEAVVYVTFLSQEMGWFLSGRTECETSCLKKNKLYTKNTLKHYLHSKDNPK